MPSKRKRVGRTPSPEGRVAIKLTVPPYVAKRLKASGNASAAVKALVDVEIARVSDNPKPAEIVQTREEAGLTQTDAAALLYTTLSGWQRWEYGERRMHPAMWEYFCLLISFADVERARRTWLELPGGKFDQAQVNQTSEHRK